MCWMTGIIGDGSNESALRRIRAHETYNGHAYGFAGYDPKRGFERIRGTGRTPSGMELKNMASSAVIGHTRFATAGERSVDNAHPFKVETRDGKTVGYMCHNGTWRRAPREIGKSDTRVMADLLGSLCDRLPPREALARLYDLTGQTVLFLTREGSGMIHCVRGQCSIDRTYRSAVGFASSNGYDVLERGSVETVAAGEHESLEPPKDARKSRSGKTVYGGRGLSNQYKAASDGWPSFAGARSRGKSNTDSSDGEGSNNASSLKQLFPEGMGAAWDMFD